MIIYTIQGTLLLTRAKILRCTWGILTYISRYRHAFSFDAFTSTYIFFNQLMVFVCSGGHTTVKSF
jgi:hypothetical protein